MRLLVCLAAALYATAAFSQGGPPGGGGPPPPQNHPGIYLEQRDFQGNRTTTERTIFPNPHPAIEYSATGPGNVTTNVSHVAYLKGSTITAQLKFKNATDFPFSGNLSFIAARLVCPGPPDEVTLSISSPQSSLSLPPQGTVKVTVTIGGVPNYVAVGGLQVKYSLLLTQNPGPDQLGPFENGTGQSGWENWVRVCLLDSAPIGLQAVPWTDFLEYTCRWVFGASGTTQVLSEMTKGIHYSERVSPNNRLHYGDWAQFWSLGPTGNTGGTYDLKKCLDRMNSPSTWSIKSGNCSDFAGLLHLALLAHGTQTECQRYRPELTEFFHTWPLSAAGTLPTVTGLPLGSQHGTFWSRAFRFHVVVKHMGQSIYDASNAYYFGPDGSSYLQPVIAWSATTYWQQSSQPHWGLAYSSNQPFTFSVSPTGSQSQSVSKILTVGLNPTALQ